MKLIVYLALSVSVLNAAIKINDGSGQSVGSSAANSSGSRTRPKIQTTPPKQPAPKVDEAADHKLDTAWKGALLKALEGIRTKRDYTGADPKRKKAVFKEIAWNVYSNYLNKRNDVYQDDLKSLETPSKAKKSFEERIMSDKAKLNWVRKYQNDLAYMKNRVKIAIKTEIDRK